MKTFAIMVGLATLCGQAAAQDKPAAQFHEQAQYQMVMCTVKAKTALLKAELGDGDPWADIGACLRAGRADVKKVFPKAVTSVTRNPAAAKLLKDYYAAWITTFNGIAPNPSERKTAYEQRQLAAETRNEELWNRFALEADL
jgi:hypothetical protein